MFLCGPRGPGLDGGGLHLNRPAAVAAQQVVVVHGHSAAPVDSLAVAIAQHIHKFLVGQGLQDPVGSGQRNRNTLVLEYPVQLLGAHEVIELVQGCADSDPLLGDALLFPAGRRRRRLRPAVSAGALWHWINSLFFRVMASFNVTSRSPVDTDPARP